MSEDITLHLLLNITLNHNLYFSFQSSLILFNFNEFDPFYIPNFFSLPTVVNVALLSPIFIPYASCCCSLPWMAGYWLLPTGAFSMS